jgi:hypothetical protein
LGTPIWDAKSGQHVFDLPLEGSTVPGFSPDGRWLATRTAGVGLRLWEAGTWRPSPSFPSTGLGASGGPNVGFAFSPDKRLIALNDIVGAIRLIELETGVEIAQLTGPEATWYQPAAFTPDGTRLIATCSGNKALYVWDLRQLRSRLKEMRLDWEWPEFPAVSRGSEIPAEPAPPLSMRVDAGFLRQPAFTEDRQAIAAYSLALTLCPLNWEAHLQRAAVYIRMKNHAGALADLERLLAFHQDTMGCDSLFAALCNDLSWYDVGAAAAEGRADRLLPLARKAVELEPDNSMYRNTLGVVLYRVGRYRDAIDCLERNSKDDSEFFAFDGYFLAMSYHRLGNSTVARSWFERSNAWVQEQTYLPADWSAELAAIRPEVTDLLGIKSPNQKP